MTEWGERNAYYYFAQCESKVSSTQNELKMDSRGDSHGSKSIGVMLDSTAWSSLER